MAQDMEQDMEDIDLMEEVLLEEARLEAQALQEVEVLQGLEEQEEDKMCNIE